MTNSRPVGNEWVAPSWAWPLTLALSLAGLGVSIYLTYAHYTTASVLACPDRGIVNCAKVITSPQSEILGIPVALTGLLFFAAMTALCTPWAWNVPVVRFVRIAMAGVSMAMVLYLIYVELLVVDAICLYCTAVHAISLVLFGSVIAATVLGDSSTPSED